MKRVLPFLLVLSLLAACRPPEGSGTAGGQAPDGVRTRIELNGPARIGPVPVTVFLLGDGEGISGATVTVTGDMTHAGMVPVIRTAAETAPGEYTAADFEFNMGGDWFLLAAVTLPDGTSFEVVEPVSVSGN